MRPWYARSGITLTTLARVQLAAALLLMLAGLFYILNLETSARAVKPLQVDELYFLTCAARAVVAESGVVTGCHDNKGPLIYMAYAAGINPDKPFDLIWIKRAGAGIALLNVFVAACLARLLAGGVAAAVTIIFAISLVMVDPGFMALKTESLAILFSLMATALWVRGLQSGYSLWHHGLAGGLMGLAIMSNQKFGLVLGVSLIGLVLRGRHVADRIPAKSYQSLLIMLLAIMAGTLLPFMALVAYFYTQGRLHDFLASLFLYPSLYGSVADGSFAQVFAWRLGLVADRLRPFIAHALVIAGMMVWLTQWFRHRQDASGQPVGFELVALPAVAYFLLCISFSILFSYHFNPAFLYASVAIGVAYVAILKKLPEETARKTTVFLVLIFSLVQVLAMWKNSEFRSKGDDVYAYLPVENQGGYAYVVGQWPAFYAFNQLIPASDVLYPNALSGAEAAPFFRPPAPGTLKARWLADLRNTNESKLLADFSRTPPRYIFVIDMMGRVNTSEPSNMSIINRYIAERCSFSKRVTGYSAIYDGSLYVCQT